MILNKANNEIKGYINEISFMGSKYQIKLIKLINKYFYVDLPIENYLYLDINIQENGNVSMKDVIYKTKVPIKDDNELEERYNNFKEEIESILKKTNVNFETKNRNNNIKNIIITLLLTILVIIVLVVAIIQLFRGNIYGTIWFIIILVSYNIIPNIRDNLKERYSIAFRYLKKVVKNLKK